MTPMSFVKDGPPQPKHRIEDVPVGCQAFFVEVVVDGLGRLGIVRKPHNLGYLNQWTPRRPRSLRLPGTVKKLEPISLVLVPVLG